MASPVSSDRLEIPNDPILIRHADLSDQFNQIYEPLDSVKTAFWQLSTGVKIVAGIVAGSVLALAITPMRRQFFASAKATMRRYHSVREVRRLLRMKYSSGDLEIILGMVRRGDVSSDTVLCAHRIMTHHPDFHYNYADAVGLLGRKASITAVEVCGGNQPFLEPIGREGIFALEMVTIDKPGVVRVYESWNAKIVGPDVMVTTPGLNQCRATYIFNLDNNSGTVVYHSSTGIGDKIFPAIAALGKGEKRAFIIGEWSGRQEAELLNTHLNMPVTLIRVDAVTHTNVTYNPMQRALIVGYGDGTQYYKGTIPVPFKVYKASA